ncbi:MAG: PAS domain-containing protein [Arcobacter sp.]|nr:PAS domain-containing protein [Arcobacter sp.]
MKKIILITLVFLNCLFASINKDVLILHSYHKGYAWSDNISKTLEKEFSKYPNIELNTVYMDTKRVSSSTYYSKLASLYKEQFKNRHFDLIIASDNNAFDFVNKYHEKIFKNTPVLFCGINNFNMKEYKKKDISKYSSGIVEEIDLEKNFELIFKIQNKMKNLLIINDKSKTGLAIKKDLKPIIKKYSKNLDITYIDNMDLKDIKKQIKKLHKNDAILFVLLTKDKTSRYFTYKQSIQEVKKASSVPIYGVWDFYLNYGMMGGLVTSSSGQANAVYKMAIQVLNGKNIKDIPILLKSPNLYTFDYKEVKNFNINLDDYLDDYKLINNPNNSYENIIKLFVISVLIILILTIIVLVLRRNIEEKKKVELALLNQLEFDKVLLDTIPNAIYHKNIEGEILDCNLAFSKLVNKSKDEIRGKTAYDFFAEDIARKNRKLDKKLLETFATNSSEFVYYDHKNQMKNITLNKAVYKNVDGNIGGIVCIMDDMTQRVQEKQFMIQQSKLAEMGDMIAAIAHQWNEPLVELSALVQDIQTSFLLGELKDDEVESFVNNSMVQIKYMSQTLSDFRNFLKPSTKKTLFPISKALNEINEIIGKQIFYSNIKMSFFYHNSTENLLLYGYENEFKQVLLNLINNAKNKIVSKNQNGNININIDTKGNFNIIQICDDGGAIDEKIINSIFEPYFTTREDGTGYGLYMAKVIIEDKMQGKIKVRNDKNNVIFTIKLPNKDGVKK